MRASAFARARAPAHTHSQSCAQMGSHARTHAHAHNHMARPRLMACRYSLSTDANAKNVPSGHTVKVREIRTSAGAGLIVAICGDIMTVPGLPTRPGFFDIDFDFDRDRIVGIF